MTLRYSNRQLLASTLFLLSTLVLMWWADSDLRMSMRISGKTWSFQRESHTKSNLSSLMLNTPIQHWYEQGHLQLLSKNEAQMDESVRLGVDDAAPGIKITIQGRWQIADGFLVLKADNYSALPLNEAAQKLLKYHGDALKELLMTMFNRSRPVYMLNDHFMLLNNEGDRPWVLNDSFSVVVKPLTQGRGTPKFPKLLNTPQIEG